MHRGIKRRLVPFRFPSFTIFYVSDVLNFGWKLTVIAYFNCSDLEWKIIYVGSAENDSYDQVLDSVWVGPVPVGTHTFLFEVIFHLAVRVVFYGRATVS